MSEQPIPDCLGPRPVTARPAWHVPHGSWDTHFHALGPQLRFPYGAKRKYTPPDAPVEQCLRLHEALGFARGWVVHANTHGFGIGPPSTLMATTWMPWRAPTAVM